MKKIITLLPILLTVLLILWTALVYKYSQYGSWHIYPALVIAPLVLLCHIGLIMWNTPKMPFVLYALGHLSIFLLIWFGCLMLISKDSL
jgi:hypothetical protein